MADRPPETNVTVNPPLARRLRVAVVVLAATLVLLGGVVLLALTPAVQTALVQRILRDRPNLGVSVGRVELGLSRSVIRDLTFASSGVRLVAPRVEAEVALLPALFGAIRIQRLEAKEWVVELVGPTVTAAAALPVPAPVRPSRAGFGGLAVLGAPAGGGQGVGSAPATVLGLLDQVALPENFELDQVLLQGTVRGVLAGEQRGSVAVQLKGGGLKAGAVGVLDLTADGAREGSPDRLQATTRVEVAVGPGSRLDAVRTNGTLSVQVAGLPAGASVAVESAVERALGATAGESYLLIVRREGVRWLDGQAERSGATGTIRGTLKIAFSDRDIAPVLPGRPLPEFSLQVENVFTAGRAFEAVEVAGKIAVEAARWERLSPELGALGAVRLTSDFGLAREGDRIRVGSLRAEAVEKAPVLGIELRQPFIWNPVSGEVEVADPAADLLTVRLRGLPLPALQAAWPDGRIEGGIVTGGWSLRASSGGIAVRSTEPMAVSRFSVRQGKAEMLRDVQLEVRPSADFTPRGWQGEAAELVVRGGNVVLARGAIRAGRSVGSDQAIKLTGALDLDLPGMLAQPLVNAAGRLQSGLFRVSGSASLGEVQQVAVDLQATRLVDSAGGALPDVAVEIRGDRAANGALTVRIPVRLEASGRVSDVVLAGQLAPESAGWRVDGQITGARVFVADARILAAPWAAAPASPASAPGSKSPAPAWAGLSGKVALALGEVVYSPELIAREISGTVALDQMGVVLETLKAILATGGRVEASGKLSYSSTTAATAYALEGNVTALELDSGPALKAFLPSSGPSAIEGRFDLRSRVSGGAASLGDLAGQLQGDLRMVSRGGVIRPLPPSYLSAVTTAREQLQRRGEQAGTLGALAGALGARLPSSLGGVASKTQQLTTRLADLETVLRLFGEIRFDQLTLDVGVSPNQSASLRDLTITSPELRFVGQGSLLAAPGQPFWRRPLSVSMTGGARGRSADALRRVNLLGNTIDTLGYAPFSLEFALEGTPNGLDASKMIAAVADRVLGVSLTAADVQRLRAGDPAVLLSLVAQLK